MRMSVDDTTFHFILVVLHLRPRRPLTNPIPQPLTQPTDDDATGVPFHSAKFPALRHLIHTGFDVIEGVENLKHIFLPLEPEQVRMRTRLSTLLLLPTGQHIDPLHNHPTH